MLRSLPLCYSTNLKKNSVKKKVSVFRITEVYRLMVEGSFSPSLLENLKVSNEQLKTDVGNQLLS